MRSLLVAIPVLAAVPASAQTYVAPPPAFPAAPNPDALQSEFSRKLQELRKAAIAQQESDGGKLSAVSIATLRARFARLEERHKRELRNADRAEVNMLDSSWQ